jgi:toxin ParE1/3/4
MTRVVYSKKAEAELVDLAGYIAIDSEHNADAFTAKLRSKVLVIARSPRIYRLRNDIAPEVRLAALGRYVILFRIVDGWIEVLHVVHGSRDLKQLFPQ